MECKDLAAAANDSVLSRERSRQIVEMSTKYETEKKEQENKLLKSEGERQRVVNIAITSGLVLCAALAFFIFRGYRQKQKANRELGEKNVLIEQQKRVVEEKNKDITDSIRYAKRLQSAILKPENNLAMCFEENFVLFKPKDIVSGDFYWFEKFGKRSLVAAADCTGHGVPGAFMSIIGCNLLSQAVNEYAITQPAAILNSVNKGLSKVLQQRSDEPSVKDGMDIALCAFDPEKMTIEFAGAYNPLWIVRNGQVIELKADKFPVGAFVGKEVRLFTNQEVQVQKGDMVYMFSDGYADQFGGPQGKKFKYSRMRQMLTDNCKKPMKEQREVFNRVIEDWKDQLEQIDDILLIGVKI
ncbi:MAG: SpoIIE family protein phosphatase [Bacteroidota bacterium]